ncbi:MAG: L,D-transpeptidase family protein [Pseudomonadota bacterium]
MRLSVGICTLAWHRLAAVLGALVLSGCLVTPVPEDAQFADLRAARSRGSGTPVAAPAVNRFRLAADTQVVGRLQYTRVRGGETLLDIARAYDLGYEDILAANPGVDPWTPVPGERVLLPLAHVLPDAPREGIVINLAARRLFHYPPAEGGAPVEVITHPIGIGREGWSTPLGTTRIAEKRAAPAWTVPASIRREHAARGEPLPAVVPPGPDNPLGSHALRLGWPSILIHGTNKPAGIGMRVSHGCIQLYPEDIAPLFEAVPEGTPVRVVDQPYLAGFGPDGLVLEAHVAASRGGAGALARDAIERTLRGRVAGAAPRVDWELVRELVRERRGYPLPIGAGGADRAALLAALPEAPPRPLPAPPAPGEGEWFVDLGTFAHARAAQRLVAMLGYQGPPIPARRLARDGTVQVLAGPWASREAAAAAARRIARDLEAQGRVVRRPEAQRES